jgi:hypothetical protein
MPTPPDTLRERFFASDFRVGDGIATFADLDTSLFEGLETIEQVSADRDAMDAIAATEDYRELVRSVNAMDAQLADTTAMNAVGASQTARDAIRADSGVLSRVRSNSMPVAKFILGTAGGTPSTVADMADLAANATAMNAVAASQAARDEVRAVPLAKDAIRADSVGAGKFVAGAAGLTPSNFSDIAAVTSDPALADDIGDDGFLAELGNSTAAAATQLHLNSNVNPDYWDSIGSQETWNGGNFVAIDDNPPVIGQSGDTISGGSKSFSTPIGSGYSIGYEPVAGGFEAKWEREFNFDNISEVIATTRNENGSSQSVQFKIGSDRLLNYTASGTTTHTITVNKTGKQVFTIRFNRTGSGAVASEVGVLEFN